MKLFVDGRPLSDIFHVEESKQEQIFEQEQKQPVQRPQRDAQQQQRQVQPPQQQRHGHPQQQTRVQPQHLQGDVQRINFQSSNQQGPIL